MKNPKDFKKVEVSERIKVIDQNREIIGRYFNEQIRSSEGGEIKIVGALDNQTKKDYLDFLEEWGWSVVFREEKNSGWSITSKSETEYNVTILTVTPEVKR